MNAPKRYCKCECGTALRGGRSDREFVNAAHRQRYERKAARPANPELAAAVATVLRLVKQEELPDEYAESIQDLLQSRREVLDVPAMIDYMLEGVCETAMHHGTNDPDKARLVSFYFELTRQYGRGLVDLGRRIQAAAEQAAETFVEGRFGEEIESAIYPAQINHWYQNGEPGDEEGGELL